MAMDKELKAKWIDALRSGQFLQARGVLEDDDGSKCCLGVLCAIQDANWKDANFPDWENDVDELMTTAVPEHLAGGLKDAAAGALALLNDGADNQEPYTFAQIADYLEQHEEI